MKSFLWQCDTFEDQKEWCRTQFEKGRTLTDPGIWLGGADPEKIIAALRHEGMPLKTCRVQVVDAAGIKHPNTLAWCLDTQTSEGQSNG